MLGTRSGVPRSARSAVMLVVVMVAVAVAAVLPDAQAGAAARVPGTGKPPAGSGINTAAALANPLCDKTTHPYGTLDFVIKGGGAFCTTVWEEGKDNGGATYQGVTKDSIKVIAIIPNEQQAATIPASPTDYATGGPGTYTDSFNDSLAAFEHTFGGTYTYGRDIDLEFVVSSGSDEATQRADAVAVIAKKPFAVIDGLISPLEVFDTEIAKAKILMFSLAATVDATLAQAPYRWAQQDPTAGTMNGAEFIGKQLAGKKAKYAGDPAMHDQTRKLGLVRSEVVDVDYFNDTLSKYDAKLAPGATITYPGDTSTLGSPTIAQEQAPTAITKLKDAGVTTVILLADSQMVGALTKQATLQEYQPEWIYLASQNIDTPVLARVLYDKEQWRHALGLSNVFPPTPPTATTATTNPNEVQWYFGPNAGTFFASSTNHLSWLVFGIMYAGPNLTPQTFKQGHFAVPAVSIPGARGGVCPASQANRCVRSGFGRRGASGLPYDEYMRGNKDFTPSWWDPDTAGVPGAVGAPVPQGTLWFPNNAKRYYAGQWPTKPLKFFDKAGAISQFDAPPVREVIPCGGCPSETGQATPS